MSSLKSSTIGRLGLPVLMAMPSDLPPSVKSTIMPCWSLWLSSNSTSSKENSSSLGRPTIAICLPVARMAVNLVPSGTKMDFGLARMLGAWVVRMVIPNSRSLTTRPMADGLIGSAL